MAFAPVTGVRGARNPAPTVRELLARGHQSFSFEFSPPKDDAGEQVLWNSIRRLEGLSPTFVSVTYGAGGSTRDRTARITGRIAAETTLTPVAHLTCVSSSRSELRRVVGQYADEGVRNVLALRGDPPPGEDEWTATEGGLRYSRELIELIRDDYDFAIGAACFPEVHIHAADAESDLRYTKEKVDAGARFLICQVFFDNRYYYEYVARAREIGIDVPILPGIMPITNSRQIQKITSLCGSEIPERLAHELELRADEPEAATDFGVAYATLQCADLLTNGAPGIHFYTLNRSPATRAILSALRCMAPWRGAVPA